MFKLCGVSSILWKSKEHFDKVTLSFTLSLFFYIFSVTFTKLTIQSITLPPFHRYLFNCSAFGLLVFLEFTHELFHMLQFSFSTDLLKFKSSSMLIDRMHKKQELTKHITLHANGEPLFKRSSSHSHSSPVLQRFCLSSGLPMGMVIGIVLLLPR